MNKGSLPLTASLALGELQMEDRKPQIFDLRIAIGNPGGVHGLGGSGALADGSLVRVCAGWRLIRLFEPQLPDEDL